MGVERYRYSLEQLAPPGVEPVSPDQARRNCSIDDGSHDETLAELVRQAREYVEQRAAVSLVATQWRLTCDRFPRGSEPIYPPLWPLLSVDSIDYDAADGTDTPIDADLLAVRRDRGGQGRLRLKNYAVWPQTLLSPDAVRITFTAGFGPDPQSVPAPWQRAILMLVSHWFENREAAVVGTNANAIPFGVESLIMAAAALDDFRPFDLG